ncbi:FG-GAP repeat protein [Leptospira sanjuanensis]|uniref:FG-GAP repeat protein n=1 Tax=Leptospira sanjuanensis TaxID=2879643 RepID=UPI001EE8780D|nr:FG-GAP repeat protein [Leptospira sanjuanensis]MCG6167709.1 FG-GAP repeat protein [Leptospira sanjuanensis]
MRFENRIFSAIVGILFFLQCLGGGEAKPFYGNLALLLDAPLSDLKYPIPMLQYTKFVPIPTIRPSVTGVPSRYSISPSLPTGIDLDVTTGALSGIPTESLPATEYTITASNAKNSVQTTIRLQASVGIWQNGAYIKASNADIADYFGNTVAIDGDTIAVGAYQESSAQTTITNGTTASSDNGADSSGAVYVYRRNGAVWAQEAYIKAPNAEAYDYFGYSLAISGDTLVVGAYLESSSDTTITNGTTASADNSAGGSGAVYVFRRSGANWVQEAYLKAPNAEAGDSFGYSVAIFGDTIAVGAFAESSGDTTITNGTTASADNSAASSGAVYVYRRSGTAWAQEAYLKASNADAGDLFGYSVAIHGDTIAVGANGESSNQITITNGTTASADNSKSESGAVYVYKRTGAVWTQEAYLKANNASAGNWLGYSVAISGDTIVSGATGESEGAAYVFVRVGTTWTQQRILKPVNPGSVNEFGNSLAISGDTIVVGSYWEGSNANQITNGITASTNNSLQSAGAAYVYQRTGTTWAQESYLKAKNVQTGDWFGMGIGISGDTILAGAPQEDSGQTTITQGTIQTWNEMKPNSGAVYIFNR